MLTENQPRVLVVDDLADMADSLTLLLRLWGYAALACYEGSAVVETVRAYQPHVVLLDLGMPRVDGFQVAQSLREETGLRHAVLIAVTGYGDAAYRIRARELGFHGYLVKPVDPCALHDLLIQAAGRPGFSQVPHANEEGLLHGRLPLAEIFAPEIPQRTAPSLVGTFSLAGVAL